MPVIWAGKNENFTMTKIDVYTKPWCPCSGRAINLLAKKGMIFNEINVTAEPGGEEEMRKRSGRQSVPQIFVGHVHIGGSDDLFIADKNGLLDELLA